MPAIRNFAIISHIDHGKSTLADRLLELTGTIEKRKMQAQYLDMHPLERERGITIKLQPVRMEYVLGGVLYVLNLIDTPGHVDFAYEVSRSLAAVEGAILLVDATKGVQAQTVAHYRVAKKQGLMLIPVINKIDLPNARIKETETQIKKLLDDETIVPLLISAKNGEGVERVLEAVITRVPEPVLSEKKPLRALIFDSEFDSYKGVVAHVRVFEGVIGQGAPIYLMAPRQNAQAQEVGIFNPAMQKKTKLCSGEIGYIATGLKEISLVRVGDTITQPSIATISPLAGYQEPQPVVFASLYPHDADTEQEGLRDALSRLKLEDASLVFEPESSPGLGRGFRCGFLGMLHAEIIVERLKREFGLALIITTPSVEHIIKYRDKQETHIRSATDIDSNAAIEYIKEPIFALEIFTPQSYIGTIMKLLPEYRGVYQGTSYLSSELVSIEFEVPLAEIVVDFYDRLKSATAGYASMSYVLLGFRRSDLLRLDILVAGEIVEPFSRILHRSKAYAVGRELVKKLKKVLPRQLFVVPIQAAIGGKVIARETLSAQRKDVTGYLYGGDVSRKKKLLKKQKRGKKLLKERSSVTIPQEVFLKMMKK